MGNLNNVQIIGRLGKDPEMRYTQGGTAVCKFSVAVEAYRKQDQPKHTEWFNVVAWSKLAEVCAQYLGKGDLVYCQGELQTRQYEKDGQRRYFTELNMRQMQMLHTKPKGERQAPQSRQQQDSQPPDFDDEIPF